MTIFSANAADLPRPSSVRYYALGWLCLAAAIAYICRQSIAGAESTIRADLGLSEEAMGAVMGGAFFSAYALFQLPAGWLAYRWGTRRLLPVLAVLWSLATAAMGLAKGLPLLFATRFANGMAQAGLFTSTTDTISRWFPSTMRAFPNGALAACMYLGAAIGTAGTATLLDWASWRWIFAGEGILGLLWAIGFYLWFRDLPRQHPAVNAAELALIGAGARATPGEDAPKEQLEPTPWLAIVSSPAMWCIGGQQFFRAAGQIFFGTWFPTYLQETRGLTVKESGMLNTLPLLTLVAGSFLGGILSDAVLARTGSRKLARQGVATVTLFACALFVFAAYAVEDTALAVAIISAGTFTSAIGGPCAYTITIDMGGRHVATVFSVMNLAGNIGALIFPIAVPWFRAATSWESVLLLFGAMYLGAAASWFLLKPDGTIFEQSLLGAGRRATPPRRLPPT